METNNYHRTIIVNAPATEVLKKISLVNLWWTKNVKGKTEKRNDKFTVDFGETFVDFQITELVPNKKVVWLVTDCNLHWIDNKKEWKDTEVVFTISSAKNKTKIDFTHIGLIPTCECYESCEIGWTRYISDSLAKFINDGKGKPQ